MNSRSKQNKLRGPNELQKWCVAGIIFLVLFVSCSHYVFITTEELLSLKALSFASAAMASLMFALALVASSISYYTGWPNLRWGYQKQIGVLAFWTAAFYCTTLLLLYPELYGYGLKQHLFSLDVFLGGAAMSIFTAMVIINSKLIAPFFSKNIIKFVLGLGYVGYALLVIRAIFLEWDLWEFWITTLEGYPPGRLILSTIAVVVLLLRISIPIHREFTSKK